MNCDLCVSPLRRTKSYSIYETYFNSPQRLVDIIAKYLQMEVKSMDSQSSLICQSCYTHLDDFHKFALLIKQKQESLLCEIPTIKVDDSDDEEEEEELSYIRDTDVLVEFKTEDERNEENIDDDNDVSQEELLIATEKYRGDNSDVENNTSLSSFDQMSWLKDNETPYKSKRASSKLVVRKTPYKTHAPEDRGRIVDAANRGDDWSALASKLGVKYKTAYTWVSASRKEMLKRSGKTSFTEEEIQTIIQWIEKDKQLTLKEIVAKVKSQMKKDVCVYFVEGTLEGRLFQNKCVSDCHSPLMNSLENKTKRCEYVSTLKYYMDSNKTIVWLGETSYKIFCRRAKGRFNTNSTFFASCDPTIFMIGAISQDGPIIFKRGRVRLQPADIFKTWKKFDDLTKLVVVCDSDACFSELDEFFNSSEVTLLLLSPYSYMLNPLESIWDIVKKSIKGQTKGAHANPIDARIEQLSNAEKCIDGILPDITRDICIEAIENTNHFHDSILDMQDVALD